MKRSMLTAGACVPFAYANRALVALGLVAALTHPTMAKAAPGSEDPGDFVLVLDASGSMRAKVENKPKMSIAREVIHDLVEDLPAGTQTGLFAYGHRHRFRCDDIEMLVAPKPLDKAAFNQRVDAIQPKGKTPLTAAAKTAIEYAKQRKRRTTVVLVSDGLETCHASPCEMVKKAKAEGVDFVLHVVGFDLKGQDTKQLRCAAEASGGRYLEADSATELSAALHTAAAVKPEPEPKPEAKGGPGGIHVTVTRHGKGGQNPQPTPAVIRAVGTDGEKRGDAVIKSEYTFKTLPEGTYTVHVEPSAALNQFPSRTFENIKVSAGKTVELPVKYAVGVVRMEVTLNGKPVAPQLAHAWSENQLGFSGWKKYQKGSPGIYEFELVEGAYESKVNINELTEGGEMKQKFHVKVGETQVVKHAFQFGDLSIVAKKGGNLVSVHVSARSDKVAFMRPLSKGAGTFHVPPGMYSVRVSGYMLPQQEFKVEIKTGQTVKKELNF